MSRPDLSLMRTGPMFIVYKFNVCYLYQFNFSKVFDKIIPYLDCAVLTLNDFLSWISFLILRNINLFQLLLPFIKYLYAQYVEKKVEFSCY